MTKGEIIEGFLKELRSGTTGKRKRTSEDDDDEQDVITHLEAVFHEAQPGDDILTCPDFVHLTVECRETCHHYSFPYDMSPMVKLKTGEYAWICCGVKRAAVGQIPVETTPPEQPAKSTGYKPFADFFGGNEVDDGN